MRFENSFGMTEDEYDKFLADTCESIISVADGLKDDDQCMMEVRYKNGEVVIIKFHTLTQAKSHFYCSLLPKWETKDDIPESVEFLFCPYEENFK